jgi:hypothetical protein
MYKFSAGTSVQMQDNTSSALTSGGAVLTATAILDNTPASGGYFWATLELVGAFGTAPTAAKAIELYLVPAPDGTDYADSDNTTPNPALLAGYFIVRATTSSQRITIPGVPLRPYKYKAYLRNQADQSLSAGWVLTAYPEAEQ